MPSEKDGEDGAAGCRIGAPAIPPLIGGQEMKGRKFADVWDALEPVPEVAAQVNARATLMTAVRDRIVRARWTQAEAARRLGVTQPRISTLMRGKLSLFSLDTLLSMATAAGLRVEIKVRRAA
jgi:predicted XRE-type DNA-binding protein